MRYGTILLFFSLQMILSSCVYDIDRSKIPECYSDDECPEGKECSEDNACVKPATDTDDKGNDSDSGVIEGVAVSGRAVMGQGLPTESYATGDVYLTLVTECPSMTNPSPGETATVIITGAKLDAAGDYVPFIFDPVPEGTFYLTGFFDHNGNADADAPAPDTNDVIGGFDSTGDGAACVQVDVGAESLSDVEITLDFAYAF